MKVVVDANILVSAFLSPHGSPSEITRMIVSGHLRVCYDMRILNEHKGVFERPKFRISPDLSAKTLERIRALGESTVTSPWPFQLPDPKDVAFLEVVLAAQAECLITGNLKHFPSSCRQGIRVFSPAEFLEFYRSRQDRAGGKVKSSSAEYRSHDVGDTAWTSEEVAQVIQGIRRSTPSRKIRSSIRKNIKDLTKKPRSRTPFAKARARGAS